MKRVLTAAVLIPVILYVVFLAPWWLLFGVTALVALICYSEYSGIARAYGMETFGPVGYGAGLLILAIQPQDGYLVFTLLALVALCLGLRTADLAKSLPQAALLLLPLRTLLHAGLQQVAAIHLLQHAQVHLFAHLVSLL